MNTFFKLSSRIFLTLIFLIALVSLTPRAVEAGCWCLGAPGDQCDYSRIGNSDCPPEGAEGQACCKDDPVEPTDPPNAPTSSTSYYYVSFECDRCWAAQPGQKGLCGQGNGVNPRYSQGYVSTACSQIDRCVSNTSNCSLVKLCDPSCSGPEVLPTSPPVGPTSPPAPTKTPTPRPLTPTPKPPTPTPIPLLQCSRVAVLKNGVEVPAPYTLVKYMDRVTFRGFANATGRTATSMTFSHSIIPPGSTTGRATTTTVPMTLVGNIWQADYTYLMIDAGTHRVEAVSIQ